MLNALSLATKAALDVVILSDIKGFYTLLGYPIQ